MAVPYDPRNRPLPVPEATTPTTPPATTPTPGTFPQWNGQWGDFQGWLQQLLEMLGKMRAGQGNYQPREGSWAARWLFPPGGQQPPHTPPSGTYVTGNPYWGEPNMGPWNGYTGTPPSTSAVIPPKKTGKTLPVDYL